MTTIDTRSALPSTGSLAQEVLIGATWSSNFCSGTLATVGCTFSTISKDLEPCSKHGPALVRVDSPPHLLPLASAEWRTAIHPRTTRRAIEAPAAVGSDCGIRRCLHLSRVESEWAPLSLIPLHGGTKPSQSSRSLSQIDLANHSGVADSPVETRWPPLRRRASRCSCPTQNVSL